MRYYLVAGERSGDLHASKIIRELTKLDQSSEFRYYGGDLMQNEGGEMVMHYTEYSFMGAWEVFKNLKKIKRILAACKEDILAYRPDALILVDFSGFNMKLAHMAKENGIPVHYYISPKVWAWNVKRAYKVKELVDHLYCILPFEVDFYKKYDYPVDYCLLYTSDAADD